MCVTDKKFKVACKKMLSLKNALILCQARTNLPVLSVVVSSILPRFIFLEKSLTSVWDIDKSLIITHGHFPNHAFHYSCRECREGHCEAEKCRRVINIKSSQGPVPEKFLSVASLLLFLVCTPTADRNTYTLNNVNSSIHQRILEEKQSHMVKLYGSTQHSAVHFLPGKE